MYKTLFTTKALLCTKAVCAFFFNISMTKSDSVLQILITTKLWAHAILIDESLALNGYIQHNVLCYSCCSRHIKMSWTATKRKPIQENFFLLRKHRQFTDCWHWWLIITPLHTKRKCSDCCWPFHSYWYIEQNFVWKVIQSNSRDLMWW